MLILYEHPLSAYAMKVKMALLEKGLEFQALLPLQTRRLPVGFGTHA